MIQNCPKCQSENFRKDGIVKNKQRYFCKECLHHFSVIQVGKPDFVKQTALILHLLGYKSRVIAKVLKVSHVSIHNWIKQNQEQKSLFSNVNELQPDSIKRLKYYRREAKLNKQYHFLLLPLAGNFDNQIRYFKSKKTNWKQETK